MKKGWAPQLWVSTGAGIILIITCGYLVHTTLRRDVKIATPYVIGDSDVITYSVERPSIEKPQRQVVPGGVKPMDPVYITLPTIGAEGEVGKVGVDQQGAIAVPSNIHRAGWFINSVRPGEKGLSIIDGHTDVRTDTAIFQKLDSIQVGDTFEIRLGSGGVQKYTVKEVSVLPVEESATVLFSQLPGVSRQLNLITCAGTYDQEHGLFTHRVVVAAELQ